MGHTGIHAWGNRVRRQFFGGGAVVVEPRISIDLSMGVSTECISTLINSININDRSYIRITAAGNNIYTKSNTTTELTDNLDISTINDAIIKKAFIPDKTLNADFIVLFNLNPREFPRL